MIAAAEFAHVFLFRCPSCHGALSSTCFKSESNLEMADEDGFRLACDCSWTGELSGFMAVRHWVHLWAPVAAQDRAAAGEIADSSTAGKEAA